MSLQPASKQLGCSPPPHAPVQQSAFVAQLPPTETHAASGSGQSQRSDPSEARAQRPQQQSPGVLQAAPAGVQAHGAHRPASHSPLQQSLGLVQTSSRNAQAKPDSQRPMALQRREQQSTSTEHAAPARPQQRPSHRSTP